MKKQITFLIDYRGVFGSKFNAVPYRSGLDKDKLLSYFIEKEYDARFISYYEVKLPTILNENNIFIHDSIEDKGYKYKSYMEDVIFALELNGAIVIPGYKYIKAHNNKVFMEMLRSSMKDRSIDNLEFDHFGTLDELLNSKKGYDFPLVVKGAEDAQGRQVRLAKNAEDLFLITKKISRIIFFLNELKDRLRSFKYEEYIPESKFRGKFILQQFVPELKNDWKILVFGNRYYILRRGVPPGDFRASGSHHNYGFGSNATPPDGIFNFAKKVYELFNVPYISLDIGYDGKIFFLIEFQFVSFGSSTHLKSDCFYIFSDNIWEENKEQIELEKLYCDAIILHIKKNSL